MQYVADRLRSAFPKASIARDAADQFLLLTNESNVEKRLERIHEEIAEYQKRITMEFKAGIYHIDASDIDTVLTIDRAKAACTSIKGHYGISQRVYDDDLDRELIMSNYVVNNIDRAIDEGMIVAYYQPIVRTTTGQVCNYETLCRWVDSDHGVIPPGLFISTLEHAHLITKLDIHIIKLACQHQAELIARGENVVPVTVNLSRLDFQFGNIFEEVEAAVEQAGIDRKLIVIELTESAFNEDDHATNESNLTFNEQLQQFRAAGYEVWMDDFGSGYSSLNMLKDYGFDALKIDMAFLRGADTNAKAHEIVVGIVDMAKRIGAHTLIEGVETPEQQQFCQHIGCEMMQGYLFSPPKPYNELPEAMRTVENLSERPYYNLVSSVNLLDPIGSDFSPSSGMSPDTKMRIQPLAIVERRENELRFLEANEAYLELVRKYQADDGQVAQDDSLPDTITEPLKDGIEACMSTGEHTKVHVKEQDANLIISIRYVGSSENAQAVVLRPFEVAEDLASAYSFEN